MTLAGCGIGTAMEQAVRGPAPTASHTTSIPVAGTAPPELPTPPGPTERAPGASSATAALMRFSATYINWTAADVSAQLRRLAADCVGQARTTLALQAAQTAADPELAQAGISNHGVVVAVAALGTGRYVVVTRESTAATNSDQYQGLGAQWHVALATVVRRAGGWVLSGWQPQS